MKLKRLNIPRAVVVLIIMGASFVMFFIYAKVSQRYHLLQQRKMT